MTKERCLRCTVVTPESRVLETNATSVVLPAHDGYVGILVGRAPLLCELGIGVLRVDSTDGPSRELFVDRGFAQVLNNEVTILTEQAALGEDISRKDAERALAEAQQMPAHDEAAVQARNQALQRAKTQLRIASN